MSSEASKAAGTEQTEADDELDTGTAEKPKEEDQTNQSGSASPVVPTNLRDGSAETANQQPDGKKPAENEQKRPDQPLEPPAVGLQIPPLALDQSNASVLAQSLASGLDQSNAGIQTDNVEAAMEIQGNAVRDCVCNSCAIIYYRDRYGS